jgi:hypothetical protein
MDFVFQQNVCGMVASRVGITPQLRIKGLDYATAQSGELVSQDFGPILQNLLMMIFIFGVTNLRACFERSPLAILIVLA